MRLASVPDADRRAYYAAALVGLRFVEARQPSGRRFGADADARFAQFRGDLGTAARLELLLRDADAQWPAAFGARAVFALRGVAEEDAFGPTWEGLDGTDAESLWRKALAAPAASSVRGALEAVATAWALTLTPFDVGEIAPAERLVVAGPSAIVATVAAFVERADLDFADQVTVLATAPAHRQLAVLATALLNSSQTARVIAADAPFNLPTHARLLVSGDADARDAARVRRS